MYKYPVHSEAVREFAEGRTGEPTPTVPAPFSNAEGQRLLQFKLSECVEFARALPGVDSWSAAVEFVRSCVGKDMSQTEPVIRTDADRISHQMDALVDDEYYTLDAAAAHGMNLARVFDEVHDANMRKRFPDGTFHLQRVDGFTKVIKPPGWVPPDIDSVVDNMFQNGSWHSDGELRSP